MDECQSIFRAEFENSHVTVRYLWELYWQCLSELFCAASNTPINICVLFYSLPHVPEGKTDFSSDGGDSFGASFVSQRSKLRVADWPLASPPVFFSLVSVLLFTALC